MLADTDANFIVNQPDSSASAGPAAMRADAAMRAERGQRPAGSLPRRRNDRRT